MDRLLVRICIYLLAPLAASLVTYMVLNKIFLDPLDSSDTKPRLVLIEPELSYEDISNRINEAGLVRSALSMRLMFRLKMKNGLSIKVGEYELTPAMRPSEIVDKLASGEQFKRQIPLHEGMSIWELGKELEKSNLISEADFSKAVVNTGLLAALGLDAPSFEGYLWPMTYAFSRPITANQIIRAMVDEGEKHWLPEYTARMDELQLSRHEVLTLASIIQRESTNKEEFPTISSVFHNRLGKGMKLQSDATVIYGMTNFNGELTQLDRDTNTPFNTYINFGLPPGPIGNPGDDAIRAALYPSDTPFLFFLRENPGRHLFYTTLEEFNEGRERLKANGEKK